MPNQAGSLEILAQELGRLLAPLEQRLATGNVLDLFAELGVQFPPALLNQSGFTGALNSGANAAAALPPLLTQLANAINANNPVEIVLRGANLLTQVVRVLNAVDQTAAQLKLAAGAIPGISAALVQDFAEHLPVRLLDYLVITYLENKQSMAASALALLGVIERVPEFGDPNDPTKPPFLRRRLQLAKLSDLIASPVSHLQNTLGWGNAGFNGEPLFTKLRQFLNDLGIFALVKGPPPVFESLLFKLQPNPASSPPGVILTLNVPVAGGFNLNVPLGNPDWSLKVTTTGEFKAGTTATAVPPADISLTPPSGTLNGSFLAEIVASRPGDPFVLLGVAGASRLEAALLKAGIGLTARWDSAAGKAVAEFLVSAEVASGKAVIDASSGDGFLSKILSGIRAESNFNLRVTWSPSAGARFEGSSTLEVMLPLHVTLGPIEVRNLYLRAGLAGGGIPLEVSTGLSAQLGPLSASVDRLGLEATLGFPADGGNLGPVDLALRFKPPNGVGLAVDAGVIKGGGYLYFDFEKEEYAGALELVFSGFITLKAIGLITTRMPDGAKGFSLLIIITAEFGTGIQLGFGFTLLAVGGLIGLNRTMRLEPLMEGVRTGAINSIMFPQDVIANAPRIISDLRTIFPPEEGKFLIGPMAKLGWGTPTLISLALGIIIEIPGNIAIVGVLKLALPTEQAAILIIQVNFAGAIEFDKKRFFFFASLFDSRVLFITIEGDMGVLMAFGDDANFVVSVGGFHPLFNPPPLPFPAPRRVAFDIVNTPVYRIRVEGYFALTTNTAQFGARADLRMGFSDFGIQGHIAFDALLQFSPFYFIIEISASVSLKAFGVGLFSIRLRFSLEGPTPWRAKGSGSISLLFFEISADFDVTWGESRDTTLPPIAVMPLLKAEFEKVDNWRALLPAGSNLLVSLRKLEAAADSLVLHPVGTLRVSQKAVPLDLPIDKVGNQKPSDAKRFAMQVTSGGLAKKADTSESFAPAQFQKLDDAAKLSRPAYEPQHGGLEISAQGQQQNSAKMVKRIVRYEEIIIDTNFKRFVRRFFGFFGVLFSHFLAGNSVSKSVLSQHHQQQLQPFAEKIAVNPDVYVVASQANNKAYSAAASFTSAASAQAFMQQQIAQNPALNDSLHIIGGYEVNTAP